MSCHDIGRGMNFVNQRIFKEFDEGNLELDVAKRLIRAAVHDFFMSIANL